jgi:two-component system cell cycle sensor histidine kinase/response regulator CckA
MKISAWWSKALDLNGRPQTSSSANPRDAYVAESPYWIRRGAIGYAAIGAAILLSSIPIDSARFSNPATLAAIRAAGSTVLVALAFALRTGVGERHPRLLAFLVPATAGATLQVLVAHTGKIASPMAVSTNFVILGIGFLIPWSGALTALASAVVIAEYAVGMAVDDAPFGWRLLDNLLVFSASGAMAVATSAILDRRRWREFADRWALAAASREARERGHRYQSVVDTAGSAIVVVSTGGRIVEFNREAERILGWSHDEVVGRHYETLGVPRLPADADGARCLDAPTRDLEIRVVARDGRERILCCNTSPLLDDAGETLGVIVCAQDITDRKHMEDALRESEARLRTVVANAPVILFTVEPGGKITLSEGRGLGRLGLAPGEVVGQDVIRAVADLESARSDTMQPGYWRESLARAFAGEAVTWQGSIGEATFECRLTAIRDAAGTVTGVLGVAIDLTERHQAEEARLALERNLLETRKLESLGLLAGGIAHDFNNLLMTVLGNLAVARERIPPGSPAASALDQIEVAARRGSDLTRQMLAYAGREAVSLEPCDVNALVGEMQELLSVSMAKGARMSWELAPDLPPIEADATQLRQVVMNLLTNASDAIGDRAGTITVRTFVADLDAAALASLRTAPDAAPGPHVCIEVADTGCGIGPATVERIFDPFFSTKLSGRGLGLATVLGIVRRHRGALGVTTGPGRGTTFRVYLPCAGGMPAALADRADEPARDEAAENGAPGRTVLLVDDEDDVRAVTQHMLERLGLNVLVASDGREGVDVFRRHATLIDAVIVDLTLPRLSGEQAFGEIRRIRPDARVFAMSGYDDERVRRRLNEGGLAGFLRKPFSVAELRSAIASVIDEPSGDAG